MSIENSTAEAARPTQPRSLRPPEGSRAIRPEEVRARLVRESLNVGLPLDNSHQLAIDTESQMTLPVTDILHYDRNPRKALNEQFEAIKASIRATRRLTSPLVVTRRPDQTQYMVGKGGNSRLTALQELFAETGDPAFGHVVVTYTPWISESDTLSAHLVENELRGEMIFWDKANAYADLKQLIEAESAAPLSSRAFEQALKERGLPLGKTTLSYFRFAVEHLNALGEACAFLSRPIVAELQPAFNALERILRHSGPPEAWPELRDRALREAARARRDEHGLAAGTLIERLEQAVAASLETDAGFVRRVRDLCLRHPGEDMGGLMAQARLPSEPATEKSPPPANAGPDGAPTRTAPDPMARIQEIATRFARMTESADCLRLAADWPTGFYMEIPEGDEPIDLTGNGSVRYFGWWMLAMLSGQLSGAWSASMPADSVWRRAQRQEHGHDEFALQHYMDAILGMPVDPLSLGGHLVSEAASVPVWLELVAALRGLGRAQPERFKVEDGE